MYFSITNPTLWKSLGSRDILSIFRQRFVRWFFVMQHGWLFPAIGNVIFELSKRKSLDSSRVFVKNIISRACRVTRVIRQKNGNNKCIMTFHSCWIVSGWRLVTCRRVTTRPAPNGPSSSWLVNGHCISREYFPFRYVDFIQKINARDRVNLNRLVRLQCGYQHRDVEYLAITHAGLHLLRKEDNQFQIMQTLTWGSIQYIMFIER